MSEDIFQNFPILDLDDIYLREINIKDVAEFFNYVSDKAVNKYLSSEDIPSNINEAENELMYWGSLFKLKRSIYWAIARKNSDKIIGTCGFNMWSKVHARAEVSYDLARKEWGKGVMTRCLRAICDFAFIRMKINRIQATVAEDNLASITVLNKNNFQQEGLLRHYGILHGVKKNFYMYSYLSQDIKF